MKRFALAAAGAAAAWLTECTSSAPSATPASTSAVTSSPAASHSAVTMNCRQQYAVWKQGPGKGLVASISAVGSAAAEAGDMQVLRAVLDKTRPALTRASRYPLPACADPKGYWTVLLMHVNAAASTGSAATLTAAMKGVPTLTRELNAELKRTEG